MKKTILYTVCLAVLTMTGCDKTVLEFPENGGIDPTLVNVNLTLAIDPKIESYEPSERSKVSEADLHDVRWIVEVFRDEIGGDLGEQRGLRRLYRCRTLYPDFHRLGRRKRALYTNSDGCWYYKGQFGGNRPCNANGCN